MAEARFVAALSTGELFVEAVEPPDLERVLELIAEYADLGLGTVDATVIAAAERLDVSTIATLDHRHFGVVRPQHVDRFDLVP